MTTYATPVVYCLTLRNLFQGHFSDLTCTGNIFATVAIPFFLDRF